MLLDRNAPAPKKGNWFLFLLAILIIAAIIAFGAKDKIKEEVKNLSKLDQVELDKSIEEFIMKHPEILIKSLQDMQKREYEDTIKRVSMAQSNLSDVVPFAGNPNGDVTILAFLDARCGHCRRANLSIKGLLAKDPNVKIIFKELPVLGPASEKLSRIALAVQLFDKTKYLSFHNALMEMDGIRDEDIDNILKKLDINPEKIKELINDPKISKELENNNILAAQLYVRGTPAFLIGEELIPEAMSAEDMLKKVQEVRSKK
jgi:protein-disulfide isomerase